MDRTARKPIGNFFIKRSLQLRLIVKIVLAVLISTLVTSLSLILVYFLKYNTIIVYQLDKISQELSREHIFMLIFPTLIFSALVNLIVAFGIGLYASRKYAVPIYKLEQWASLLIQGKITASLTFREKEEMKELSDSCNKLTLSLQQRLLKIKAQCDTLRNIGATEQAQQLEEIINDLELDSVPIEIHTGSYTRASIRQR